MRLVRTWRSTKPSSSTSSPGPGNRLLIQGSGESTLLQWTALRALDVQAGRRVQRQSDRFGWLRGSREPRGGAGLEALPPRPSRDFLSGGDPDVPDGDVD